jgi:hypothetical protein
MTERTPRRLTQLLKEIRKIAFDVSSLEMSELLNRAVRDGANGPLYHFTEQFVKNIESGRVELQYIHLETYANLFGLPTGVLLIVSRLQHESPDRAEQLIAAIEKNVTETKEKRRIVDHRLLRLISDSLDWEPNVVPKVWSKPIRTGKMKSISPLDRLSEFKRLHERLNIDPHAGLPLWQEKSKE